MIEEEKLVARAAELGARLQQRLLGFAEANPDAAITARGRGLLQALVLRDAARAAALPARAIERGVLVNVTAGNVVRFFPALNIPEDDLWPALEIVLELAAGRLTTRSTRVCLRHGHDEADALGGREVRHRGEERAVGGARVLGALELEAHAAAPRTRGTAARGGRRARTRDRR